MDRLPMAAFDARQPMAAGFAAGSDLAGASGAGIYSPQLPLTGHLRHLSNKLLELRKRAKAQPGLQIRLKPSVSSDDQRAGAFGLSNSSIAHPNLGHCPQIGDKIKIDIKSRIYRAQINFGARLYDQPPIPSCFLEIGKDDLDRTAPLWQRLGADVPAHIPHQQVGVQLAER
jgi:hypothetical protein